MRFSLFSRRRSLRRALVLGVAVLAGSAAAVIAYASIPDAGGVIHGCYQKNAGSLRVIDPSTDSCRSSEVPLNWNQTGPAGATGARGPTGPAGTDGPQGPAGPAGPSHVWTRTFPAWAGVPDFQGVTFFLFDLPSGNVFVHGSALIRDDFTTAFINCKLFDPSWQLLDENATWTSANGSEVNPQTGTVTFQGAESNAPAGEWRLQCSSPQTAALVGGLRFSAMQPGALN